MIDIRNFGGIMPRIDAKMLPPRGAQTAVNVKLWNAVLAALKAPKLVATCSKTGPITSIYRLPYSGSDYWLHWAGDVDVARGPAPDDSTGRIYYTGDGEPRVTNAEMASQKTDTVKGSNNYPGGFGEAGSTDYPRAFYAAGVHPPVTAPLLGTPTGGASASTEARAYVMTFVSAWGEESAPSPVSAVVTGKPDATWPLTQLDVAPLNTGSVIAATYSGGYITAYTSAVNSLRLGHKITVASVVGMTDLNGTWTLTDALNLSYTTVSRTRNTNVATLVLTSVVGLAVGQVITVAGLGGVSYNGTFTITGVNTVTKAITYACVAANEATTPDTAGKVVMAYFKVLKTTAQSYTSGGTWTRVAPWNVTGMTKRLYRLLSGIDGQDFKYVDEIAAATTTYSDSKLASDLGDTLPTADPTIVNSSWDLPPGDLIGVVAMPGGFLAGIRSGGKEVCFSEPGYPYAWPRRYRKVTDWPLVGLGVWGANLSVLTTAVPYRATGFAPESLSFARMEEVFPCVSKRSIVSGSAFGTIFATDRGLAIDSPGANGTALITEAYYDRERWQETVDAAQMFSTEFDGRYYGFWPVDEFAGGALIFDPRDPQGAISTNDFIVQGAWFDPESGVAYIVDAEGVKQWDADNANKQTFEWRSKKFVLPQPTDYKAGMVVCDFTQSADEAAAIAAANAATTAANAIILASVPAGVAETDPLEAAFASVAIGYAAVASTNLADLLDTGIQALNFELYGDGSLWYSVALMDSKPFRIRDGVQFAQVEIRLIGNVNVQLVQVASTMSELVQA